MTMTWKQKARLTTGGVVLVFLCVVLAFATQAGCLSWRAFWDPKEEAVRRSVFKQTRSFTESKMQDLAKYRLEYMRTTDPVERRAIEDYIRAVYADFDSSTLPDSLKTFLGDIMQGTTGE